MSSTSDSSTMGSIQVNDSNRPPLKCLIVGAGSSGIAAAKEALKAGLEPHVYEARDGPGGAWRYDKDPGPCKVDFNQDGWATFSNPGESDFRGPSPPSPMYDGLKTNVPTSLMQYRGTPFRPEISLFCSHDQVQRYLSDYADALPESTSVQYNRRVTRIRYSHESDPGGPRRKWYAEIASTLDDSEPTRAQFDHVMIANGHYSKPFVPWVEGLQSWPGELLHARWYRNPEPFKDKTVLVIGNLASGYDVTRELAVSIHERREANPGFTRLPKIYQSARSPSALGIAFDAPDAPEWASEVKVFPPIRKVEGRSILFEDGQVLDDVDTIIYATGYYFSFPFLRSCDAPWRDHPVTRRPTAHVTTPRDTTDSTAVEEAQAPVDGGLRLHNLDDRFLFYLPDPTVAFLCLPYFVIPFPLAQIQARLASVFYAKPEQLPKPLTFCRGVDEDAPETRESVIFGHPRQFDLMDRMMEESGDIAASDANNGDDPRHEIAASSEYGRTSQGDRDLRVGAKALRRAVLGY